jgi:hypothetical protein
MVLFIFLTTFVKEERAVLIECSLLSESEISIRISSINSVIFLTCEVAGVKLEVFPKRLIAYSSAASLAFKKSHPINESMLS